MTGDVLERHYRDVADAAPVPVLLYNVTMFTGVTLPADSVARLAEHPNIVGMKESGSDIAHIADCIARTPADFIMLAGSATTYFHALCAGCDGGVLALASLFPEACVRLRALVTAGSIDEARAAAAAAHAHRALHRRRPRRGRAEGRARSDRICRGPAPAAAEARAVDGGRGHPPAARGSGRPVRPHPLPHTTTDRT